MHYRSVRCHCRGFTLLEALITIAIVAMLGAGIWGVTQRLYSVPQASKLRLAALEFAQEDLEIMRNMPYDDVGLTSGIPVGILDPTRTAIRSDVSMTATRYIRNIDDPFDGDISGSIPGKPVDTAPADYKLATVLVSCTGCPANPSLSLSTLIAPSGVEGSSGNGAIFIQVIDASGNPVPSASITLSNTSVTPVVYFTDNTDQTGKLQIVDVPPSTEGYAITATKSGYSADSTLPASDTNPNPSKPQITVTANTVSSATFVIDKLSTLTLSTATPSCTPLPNINATLTGTKLLGTSPDIPKTILDASTNTQGAIALTNVEWDTFAAVISSSVWSIVGAIPTLPFAVLPNATANLKLILAPKSSPSLLVTVKDTITGLPVSNATTTLQGGDIDRALSTGRGYLWQTDWSGGSGQESVGTEDHYAYDDGNVDVSTLGELRLTQISPGVYTLSGTLTSSTFDTGGPTNFTDINWQPLDQDPALGTDPVRMQIATNNDDTTWDFVGPDATANTYYIPGTQSIGQHHDGTRYLRYRLFLQTADASLSPLVTDIAVSFTSDCIPPGQAFFADLDTNIYTLTTTLDNYQTDITQVDVTGADDVEITLSPA